MVARAKEEMSLLKAEMFNTIMYYKNMSDGVEAAIRKLSEEAFQNNFTRGCRALLTNKLMEIHWHIKLCAIFPLDNKDYYSTMSVDNHLQDTIADDDDSSDSDFTDTELEDID